MPLGLIRRALGMDAPLTIGRGGRLSLPEEVLHRFGLDAGARVVIEETERGILLRPAERTTWETYTPDRKAEFILNAAAAGADMKNAMDHIRERGIIPETLPGAPSPITGVDTFRRSEAA
jgi:bifunctional DNA-binding transcriptional regulator/antitoxin component of YhaV-PrlF toxin-antitoxin module